MTVTAVQLARDVSRDADAGGRRAGIGHSTRDVRGPRSTIVNGGGGRVPARQAPAASTVGVAEGQVLDEAGERHFFVLVA